MVLWIHPLLASTCVRIQQQARLFVEENIELFQDIAGVLLAGYDPTDSE